MKKLKQLSQRWFAFLWSFLAPIIHSLFLGERKRELLKQLSELTSKDEKLRKQKTIRILEIGIARGSNLEFYPPKSHFVGVDINENFRTQLLERLKGKDLVCEKLLYCSAECMKELDDNTFDAVISTLVVCSVGDPFKVASEVHRVLAKGGKWFLFEHGAFRNRPFQSILQKISKPWFKLAYDGCNNDRNISQIVGSGGFAKQDIKYRETKVLGIIIPNAAWYIGTVTK